MEPASTVNVAFPEFEENVRLRALELEVKIPVIAILVFASLVALNVSERTVMALPKDMLPTLVVPEIVTSVELPDAGAEPPLQFVAVAQSPLVAPVQVWPLAVNGEASRTTARAAARTGIS